MAKLSTIKKIANDIVLDEEEDKIVLKPTNILYKRIGSAPLDSSGIFFDKLSADAYAAGTLPVSKQKYSLAAAAYVGQQLLVINEDENEPTKTYVDMYQIQNTSGALKKILAEPLKGMEFNFNNKTLGAVLVDVISALGGTPLNYT